MAWTVGQKLQHVIDRYRASNQDRNLNEAQAAVVEKLALQTDDLWSPDSSGDDQLLLTPDSCAVVNTLVAQALVPPRYIDRFTAIGAHNCIAQPSQSTLPKMRSFDGKGAKERVDANAITPPANSLLQPLFEAFVLEDDGKLDNIELSVVLKAIGTDTNAAGELREFLAKQPGVLDSATPEQREALDAVLATKTKRSPRP